MCGTRGTACERDEDCESGSICAANQTCVQRAASGATCNANLPCSYGLICDGGTCDATDGRLRTHATSAVRSASLRS